MVRGGCPELPLYRVITRDRVVVDTEHIVEAGSQEEAIDKVKARPGSTYTDLSPDWDALHKIGIQLAELIFDPHCKQRPADTFCKLCGDPICDPCQAGNIHGGRRFPEKD